MNNLPPNTTTIVQSCLDALEINKKYLSTFQKTRYLAVIETVLILNGFVPFKGKLDYKTVRCNKLFFFFVYPSTRKENYQEYIIRKANEFLLSASPKT